jgi:hypothetical protein
MNFKEFITNENKQYLSIRVGEILASTQELNQLAKNLKSKDLSKSSERIYDKIKTIVHSYWPKEVQNELKKLRDVGVAIIKAVKETGNVEQTIAGAALELGKLSASLGRPVNSIGSPDQKGNAVGVEDNKGTDTSIKNQRTPAVKDQYKPPQQTKDLEKDPQLGSPVNKDPNLTDQPPLGGNSGQQLSAM